MLAIPKWISLMEGYTICIEPCLQTVYHKAYSVFKSWSLYVTVRIIHMEFNNLFRVVWSTNVIYTQA